MKICIEQRVLVSTLDAVETEINRVKQDLLAVCEREFLGETNHVIIRFTLEITPEGGLL